MGRPKLSQATSPDELKVQVLRDMHDEVLHELQDGGDVPDALVEIMGNLMATLDAWRTAARTFTLQPSSA